ncbi:hypothetical protein PVIIG_03482 [Plasmodium vivax India VII]|uniref:Uncharacterized protein n=1 Tax=Plasmodium vivax India VII TaxID=1077284 RepID=A0A0J9V870_PLAVI|nr:hypothetical protein PVIIG_03482 [Plasmodium vivax India VII]
MRRATFLLKLLLLAAIAAQEGLLSWQLMTSKTLVVLLDAGLLTVFLYLQVRSANNTHMYMIYVYSVVAKVTVIYYISLPRALTGHHGGAGGAASSLLPTLPLTLRPTTYADSIHVVSSAILLSIVVYILFFLVTDFDLLKVRLINLEMFFCLLIITHVSIDLLDISNFFSFVHFHFLLYHFRVVQELSLFSNPDLFAGASLDRKDLMDFYSFCLHAHQAVFILFGVLLCVNIAIHAYSLPSFSYESNKRRKVSSKGGGDVGGHPLSAPHLAHSYSCDVTMPRWSSDRKGANGGGGKDHYGHLHSGALTKRGSFPGGPPQLGWRHSISRGITGGIHGGIAEGIHGDIHGGTAEGTSSFSPATEAPLPRSKVGGDAMSCLKYISIYSFFFTDVSLFAARLFLCLVFSATACSPQFLMKNLCFAIIHGSRIYRKSKFYNRRRGGRAQGGSPPDEGSYTDGGSYTDEESHTDEGSHTDGGKKEEVLTPISVVSSFTLKLIKHMKGPIMLNRIIISKNLIKNTRVDNFLFFCHLKEIAIKLVLYLFACFLSLREDAINLCFVLFVFMANVLLSAAYLVLSKVDRDVAMDSIFTQALFLDLTRATRDGRGARRAGTSKSQQEKDAFHEPTAHTSVYEEYSYEYAVLFENCLNYF